MNWKFHFLFAFFLFLLIGNFILKIPDFFNLLFFSFLCGIFALLADLDHELSKSRKILDKLVPIASFVIGFLYFNNIAYALYTLIFLSGVYFLLFVFLKPKHRGFTHSIIFLLFFSAIIYFFDNLVGIIFFIGYSSHLVLDGTLKLI